MAWLFLLVAGLCEIAWAIGLKYTEGFSRLLPAIGTVAAMAASIRISVMTIMSSSRVNPAEGVLRPLPFVLCPFRAEHLGAQPNLIDLPYQSL